MSRQQMVESKSGAGVFKPSEEGFPRSQTVLSPRARACACTMSPPDVAMGPSCCFCTASQRTGRSEAQARGAHKPGGGAGDGARSTRASRRWARRLGRLGAQNIQMGCSRTEICLQEDALKRWDKEVLDPVCS